MYGFSNSRFLLCSKIWGPLAVRSASFSFVCFFNQLLKQNTPDVTLKKCSVLVGDQGKIASTFEFTWQYGHEIEFARAAAWLKRHWLHTILSQHHVMLLQKLHIQPKTLLYFKVHLKTQQKALLFLKSTLTLWTKSQFWTISKLLGILTDCHP